MVEVPVTYHPWSLKEAPSKRLRKRREGGGKVNIPHHHGAATSPSDANIHMASAYSMIGSMTISALRVLAT